MNQDSRTLADLRQEFLATSTVSMPLAGMIVWALMGVAATQLPDEVVMWLAVYVMALILPLAFLLDRMRGRALFQGRENPVTKLFLVSIVGIGLMFPLVISAGQATFDPDLVVLGVAILAGVIWIQYGWGADDPVGLRHAVVRAIGCYLAFWFAPEGTKAATICAVVVTSYAYSLVAMKKPQALHA
ncbi:MAG TPA: hypothetical protein VI168_11440 [Croceibacterium sp.]